MRICCSHNPPSLLLLRRGAFSYITIPESPALRLTSTFVIDHARSLHIFQYYSYSLN